MARNDFSVELAGHTLEYFDDEHLYLVDGLPVPSITTILSKRFRGKYDGIDKAVLKKAAEAGNAVHEAIENFVKTGEVSDLPEVRNFIFLQKQYGFEVIESEIPVILFDMEENKKIPLAAGRLDLVLRMGDQIGGADIKRTATLDKEYLDAQLNLYRLAYRQTYGVEWTFLRGIHLRGDTRKFVTLPINEGRTWNLIDEYFWE